MPPTLPRRALLAALPAAAFGCRRPSPGRLSLGVATLGISQPVYVAAERGLFASRGLDVALREYPTAQPMLDDLALGRLDAAGFAAYPIVLSASLGASRPLVLATSLVEDEQHRLSYVLRRPGATARFPQGASGLAVGFLPTIAYRKWLDALLRGAGVDPASVRAVPVAPPMQPSALADGAIDLLFTNDPVATALLSSGKAEIADDGPPCAARIGSPFPFGAFVLSASLAHDRAPLASSLVSAIDEAIALARAEPRVAREALRLHVRAEERAFVERLPDARYLASHELPAGWLDDEVARAMRLGIVEARPKVEPWSGRGRS